MFKVKFVIDENYLIIHTISSTDPSRFSSKQYNRDIIAFQNFAWKTSKDLYNILIGRTGFLPPVQNLSASVKKLSGYVTTLKKSKTFKKLLKQTEEYKKFCLAQWRKNGLFTTKVVSELTGLRFNKTFTVYLTHPSLKNGRYIGDHKIGWGHREEWPNYTTVYLWHEIMHSYFGKTDLDHAIIQLLTDEELRVQLNGGKYPPYKGHKELFLLMNRLLHYWRRYKLKEKKNIFAFRKSVLKMKRE